MMEIQFAIVVFLWLTARSEEKEREDMRRSREMLRAKRDSYFEGFHIGVRIGRSVVLDRINEVLRDFD